VGFWVFCFLVTVPTPKSIDVFGRSQLSRSSIKPEQTHSRSINGTVNHYIIVASGNGTKFETIWEDFAVSAENLSRPFRACPLVGL